MTTHRGQAKPRAIRDRSCRQQLGSGAGRQPTKSSQPKPTNHDGHRRTSNADRRTARTDNARQPQQAHSASARGQLSIAAGVNYASLKATDQPPHQREGPTIDRRHSQLSRSTGPCIALSYNRSRRRAATRNSVDKRASCRATTRKSTIKGLGRVTQCTIRRRMISPSGSSSPVGTNPSPA
jgi:hypothetical protein